MNKKGLIYKTFFLIIGIVMVISIWFGLKTIDNQLVEIETLQKENEKHKNHITYLENNVQTKTEIINESDIEVIQETVLVFVESIFNIKEDNYKKRKANGKSVLTTELYQTLFPEEDFENVDYIYDVERVESYVDHNKDESSAYVTFEQIITNTKNDQDESSYITLQVYLEKEGSTWIVNDFKQVHVEPI